MVESASIQPDVDRIVGACAKAATVKPKKMPCRHELGFQLPFDSASPSGLVAAHNQSSQLALQFRVLCIWFHISFFGRISRR
jgi:hypothetical protein